MHALKKIWKQWFGKQPKNFEKIAEFHPGRIRCFGIMDFLQTLCTLAYGDMGDYEPDTARLLVSSDIHDDILSFLDARQALIVEGFDRLTQRFYIRIDNRIGWSLLIFDSAELPPMTVQKYNPDLREFTPIEGLEEITKDAPPS